MQRDLFKFSEMQEKFHKARNAESNKVLSDYAFVKSAAQSGLIGQHILKEAEREKDEKINAIMDSKNAFDREYQIEAIARESVYNTFVGYFPIEVAKRLRANKGMFVVLPAEKSGLTADDFVNLVKAYNMKNNEITLAIVNSILSKCFKIIENQHFSKEELANAKLRVVYDAVNKVFNDEINYVLVDYISADNNRNNAKPSNVNINSILGC